MSVPNLLLLLPVVQTVKDVFVVVVVVFVKVFALWIHKDDKGFAKVFYSREVRPAIHLSALFKNT